MAFSGISKQVQELVEKTRQKCQDFQEFQALSRQLLAQDNLEADPLIEQRQKIIDRQKAADREFASLAAHLPEEYAKAVLQLTEFHFQSPVPSGLEPLEAEMKRLYGIVGETIRLDQRVRDHYLALHKDLVSRLSQSNQSKKNY